MKKSIQLLALVAIAAIGVWQFGGEVMARTTGYLYGDALVIGYPGTTVASISEAGDLSVKALAATSVVNTGPTRLAVKAKADIIALAPTAAGEVYACSNCTATAICVSTGTAVKAWVKGTDRTALCD